MKGWLKKLIFRKSFEEYVIAEMTEKDFKAYDEAHRGMKYKFIPVYVYEAQEVNIYFIDFQKGVVR